MNDLEIEVRLEQIFALYKKHGSADYIGEPVSQIEHMSQAASFAMEEGAEDDVILAAFFHDIGHLLASHDNIASRDNVESMDGFGAVLHEEKGARYLAEMKFPLAIQQMVRNHVSAKRYLSLIRPGYYDLLSDASKTTLKFQGGAMSLQEAQDFEKDPLFDSFIKLRIWDEMAKETGKEIISLKTMKDIARKILHANQ